MRKLNIIFNTWNWILTLEKAVNRKECLKEVTAAKTWQKKIFFLNCSFLYVQFDFIEFILMEFYISSFKINIINFLILPPFYYIKYPSFVDWENLYPTLSGNLLHGFYFMNMCLLNLLFFSCEFLRFLKKQRE